MITKGQCNPEVYIFIIREPDEKRLRSKMLYITI